MSAMLGADSCTVSAVFPSSIHRPSCKRGMRIGPLDCTETPLKRRIRESQIQSEQPSRPPSRPLLMVSQQIHRPVVQSDRLAVIRLELVVPVTKILQLALAVPEILAAMLECPLQLLDLVPQRRNVGAIAILGKLVDVP